MHESIDIIKLYNDKYFYTTFVINNADIEKIVFRWFRKTFLFLIKRLSKNEQVFYYLWIREVWDNKKDVKNWTHFDTIHSVISELWYWRENVHFSSNAISSYSTQKHYPAITNWIKISSIPISESRFGRVLHLPNESR